MFFWMVISGLIMLTLFCVYSWLIVHARTESIYRPISVAAFFASIPMIALAFAVTLGTAMPTGYGIYKLPEGSLKILGHKSVPGVGIFVLLEAGDYNVPYFYSIPWDAETSKMFEEMGQGGVLSAAKGERKMRIGNFEFSFDDNIPKVTMEDPQEVIMPPKMEGVVPPPAVTLPFAEEGLDMR